MKYRDLIEYDPIERVIELVSTGDVDKAKQLVETYIISDQMAERLTEVVIPQLRFDQPADNQGLMVVGDYGTGKSHLMSVLAAIAEFESTTSHLNQDAVEDAAGAIAGKFRVHRTEIGSTAMSLREIIVRELEEFLDGLDVAYEFPEQDDLVNHKDSFADLMSAFQEEYPDQGILLVVDEMLDYLAGRKNREIINDLGFLRELGEVCKTLRFRFIAGLQESLFESPRFQFAADRLRRVKDRFEQVRIVRGDVKHVVQERLLKKTADQQAKIRTHLEDFAQAFGNMTGRMDEFVRLFPVHPDYIEVFEDLTLTEKRGILRTLTQEMDKRIDDIVPDDDPGLIAFDSFWPRVEDDASLKAESDVREVLECVEVLKRQIHSELSESYQDLAVRLIHALAVQRLTVADVDTPIGVTATELRDSLSLYEPMVVGMGGDDPAADMESQVQLVLKKVIKAANGQFLTHNEDNGQFYLDLEKKEDYDAILANKADTMGEDDLDQYYFQALSYALETGDDPHVTGHKIYTHNLLWYDRNVERPGYLLFGTPNERSTAVPPLEFYVYFPQAFAPPHFDDQEREDEVFFRLAERDEKFDDALHRYAAAMELWRQESGRAKQVYNTKAEDARKEIITWIRENLRTAFTVTHAGVTKTLAEWAESVDVRERIGLAPDETGTVRDIVNATAGACLEGHFESMAPDYPSFGVRITRENLNQTARKALLQIDQTDTQQGKAVLDGLELRDGDKLKPRSSKYAQYIRDLLDDKGGDQVVNYDEIFSSVNDGEYMLPDSFRLEPEWVAVVLTALVANGDVILKLDGQKYDATSLRALVQMDPADIAGFQYVEPPKEWPVAAIRALLELLNMAPGQAQAMASGDASPIGEMQEKINNAVQQATKLAENLEKGLSVWDAPLLTSDVRDRYSSRIADLKDFLESMQNYDSLGKLKNFRASVEDVEVHEEGMEDLRHVQAVRDLQTSISPIAGYLSKAETVLPDDHDLETRLRERRGEFAQAVTSPETRSDPAFRTQTENDLQSLKSEYVAAYVRLHSRDRLGLQEDEKKGDLTQDSRLKLLSVLSDVDILPNGQLDSFKDELGSLEACTELTKEDLQSRPICPYCEYEPPASRTAPAAEKLHALDDDLDQLVDEWTASLVDELRSEDAQDDITLLNDDQQSVIEDFLEEEDLSHPLPDGFVDSVNQVLSGLTAVTVQADEVYDALRDGGAPARADEIRDRFEAFLSDKLDGRDTDEVRFVLE